MTNQDLILGILTWFWKIIIWFMNLPAWTFITITVIIVIVGIIKGTVVELILEYEQSESDKKEIQEILKRKGREKT